MKSPLVTGLIKTMNSNEKGKKFTNAYLTTLSFYCNCDSEKIQQNTLAQAKHIKREIQKKQITEATNNQGNRPPTNMTT